MRRQCHEMGRAENRNLLVRVCKFIAKTCRMNSVIDAIYRDGRFRRPRWRNHRTIPC